MVRAKTEPATPLADLARYRAAQDPVALLDGVPLTEDEAGYVETARTANTLRGYRSNWHEFSTSRTIHSAEPMPAAAATVTGYLADLARAGAKVGTMSRRLSAILDDPTRPGAPASWQSGTSSAAPPRSKTKPTGEHVEMVVLPRGTNQARCPVTALTDWLNLCGVSDGPVFRAVGKSDEAGARTLHPESINTLVQHAVARAGIDPSPYSAHSLRAGFVTYAHLRGASDRAIAHQTQPRSLATLGTDVRVHQIWTDNVATSLGL